MKGLFVDALPLLEYGVSSLPAPGEEESGDLHLVKQTERGALVAVVDGLGHGVEAAEAARLAIAILEAHSSEGVIQLVRRCHERLKHTRGAVMSLASFDTIENTVTWLGVGNIEGMLLHGGLAENPRLETIFLRPGVVGYRLPPLQAMVTPISAGDLVILNTDGIRGDFAVQFAPEDQPGQIAEYISSNFRKGDDDGLVLVLRYRGSSE
ncbi:MAG: stage sporulation protein [Bryobacterales bacterium]|nr:stage sporulation protein [Bryobacterales bacterium]